MGSPIALATSVITLVVGIGVLCTWYNYRALRQAGELWASETLRAQSSQLRGVLDAALGTSDALLDRLAPHLRTLEDTKNPEQLLTRMHALATARSGLTWMSASMPDGTFIGVFVDDRGKLRGQVSQVTPAGTRKQTYTFGVDDAPEPLDSELNHYDPRTRAFYQLAVARKRRTWTQPYTFYSSLRTGISRVEAVFDEPERPETLRFVLTVDFDTEGLARLLQHSLTKSQRQLVLASDGSVLAASGLRSAPPRQADKTQALHWSELDDAPVAHARALSSPPDGDGMHTLMVDGEAWRLRQVALTALDGEPVRLLSMLPERELFARARREAVRGLAATAVTSLLGLALALVLSSNIARLRRQRAAAERAAESAREEIAELGSYQLLEPLAVGGMGQVFRARHKLLARDAALKLIKSGEQDGEGDASREARFFQEARVLASLRSAHTVAVYDFGIASDGRYFLAMELLDGLDLEALVREHGPQPAARVASLLAQACDSLAEAHASGLVHRDIKPANLFLCRLAEWLDVIKVLDFGLTRAVGSSSTLGSVEGTPGYMSPEQARGEALGPSSDLYSLGCVGYWLLTGQHPYPVESSTAMMEAHVSAPIPELPAAIRARTPPGLSQLLTRCMAKRVEHRPVSAEQLARVLRRLEAEAEVPYTTELRSAFWAARELHLRSPIAGEPTVAMVAVRRDSLRAAG
jgi:hypothetical protein